MTKVTRRRFVQGSTALATAGGMAGILATRTPPAYAQATHRALAALERFRAGLRSTLAPGIAAGRREGAWRQDQL